MLKILKQGDTAPTLTATLEDSAGDAVDVEGADVRLLVVDAFTRLVVLDDAADVDQISDGSDGSKGKLSYDLSSGVLTELPGSFRGEFAVTFGDTSAVESFPNSAAIDIEVLPKATAVEGS